MSALVSSFGFACLSKTHNFRLFVAFEKYFFVAKLNEMFVWN